MANAEHVQVLRRGKAAWNQWRQENVGISIDLSGIEVNLEFFENPALTAQGRVDLSGINFYGINAQETSIADADLAGADLSSANMATMVFSNVSLNKANLEGATLSQSKFWNCDAAEASFWDGALIHTVFSGAKLQGANFTNANLSNANLEGADLTGAELWQANLESINLGGATLVNANMHQVNLTRANLSRCDMRHANLYEANLSEAGLDEADVRFADLRRANLSMASAAEIHYNKQSRYRSIRVSTCHGSPRFNRTANDQNYIEELRAARWDPLARFRDNQRSTGDQHAHTLPIGQWLYWIWWFSSDCGRSLWRWALMSFVFAILFGCAFYSLGEEAFYLSTFNDVKLEWSLEMMILYSLTIFGKLSYGAVVPVSMAAERWAIGAGVAGLIMLGGLITILADKVARRA